MKNYFFFRPFFILSLLFFAIPFGGKFIPPIIILLVASSIIFCDNKNWSINFISGRYYYLPLIILFITYLIGVFWSDNLPEAFKRIEHGLSFIVFPVIISQINITRRELLLLFKTFVFSCLLIVISSFIDFIYVSLTEDEYIILGEMVSGNRPGSVYEYLSQQFLVVNVHRTYFSIYLLISTSFILHNFSEYNMIKGKSLKWFGFLSLFTILIALIIIQSKAGLGIMILVLVFFIITRGKNVVKKSLLLLIFLLVAVLLFKPIINYRLKPMIEEIEHILAPGDDYKKDYATLLRPGSTEIRYMLYKSSLQLISKSPFFGYGTGDVKDVLKAQNLKNKFNSIAHLNYGPHSQIFNVMISFGLLGLLVFLGVFLFPIYKCFIERDYFKITVLSILFLSCLVESILTRQEGIIPVSLIVTIFGKYNFNNSILSLSIKWK